MRRYHKQFSNAYFKFFAKHDFEERDKKMGLQQKFSDPFSYAGDMANTIIGRFAITVCANTHGPQRMNPVAK